MRLPYLGQLNWNQRLERIWLYKLKENLPQMLQGLIRTRDLKMAVYNLEKMIRLLNYVIMTDLPGKLLPQFGA